MMKPLITFLFLIFITTTTVAQSFTLDFLFSPGLAFGSEYLQPSKITDSTNFKLTQHNLQFSQPLKTKIAVGKLDLETFSFKNLDLKASQFFLNYRLSIIQPNITDNNNYENLYKAGFGFTAITASFRKGIWIYSANIYASENSTTLAESFTPNFRGYIANISTKNLKTFYSYGGGFLVHQKQFIPFPLLGIKTKLAKKLRAEILLPIHAKLNYRINRKINFDAVVHYQGIQTTYREGSPFTNTNQTINFSQLKTYFAINTKFSSHYKLKVELGYASLQRFYDWNTKTSQPINPAPYIGFVFNYNFGKSVFGNFMEQAK